MQYVYDPPRGRLPFGANQKSQAFKALLKNDPCSLASPEWCEVPFRECPKITYEFLIDILLSIPHHMKVSLAPAGDYRDSIHNIAQLPESDRQTLENETLLVLHKLQTWWWHFTEETGAVAQLTAELTQDAIELLTIPPNVPCMFPDTLTAKSVSLYNSMVVIVYSVLMSLEECKPSSRGGMSPIPRYRSVIESHSYSVLMAAAYQNWRHPYCGDALRTGFSLKIVSWLAVNERHRKEADRIMRLWGMDGCRTAESDWH